MPLICSQVEVVIWAFSCLSKRVNLGCVEISEMLFFPSLVHGNK
jgi:hypothetical protein